VTREGPFWDVMEGRAAPPPAAILLGWELVAVDPEAGTIEVAFTASEQFLNPAGVIQGGFLAAMLDDTLGPAPRSAAYYQRPRCTTSPNGRRSGLRTGVSGRSAG
jgi:acyl-coenzyme A thioesterase PaaI-like protein